MENYKINEVRLTTTMFFSGRCDLAFMVDASSNVNGKGNFQLVKNFVSNMLNSFSLGGDVRYGLIVFSDKVEVNLWLRLSEIQIFISLHIFLHSIFALLRSISLMFSK